MTRAMALLHVTILVCTPHQRLAMGLVMTTQPAKKIKVPSGIILVTAAYPALGMKEPLIVDVVITAMPVDIIQATLKKALMSVAALLSVGHGVGTDIGVVGMRRKFLARKRPTDVT